MPLSDQELFSTANWYPAPPFFDPGVGTDFDDADLQQLLWIDRLLTLQEGAFSGILYGPLIIFVAPARAMALTAAFDLLGFTAPFRAMTVTSLTRALDFTAPQRAMSVAATMDTLAFTAPGRPMAVTSAARGGG